MRTDALGLFYVPPTCLDRAKGEIKHIRVTNTDDGKYTLGKSKASTADVNAHEHAHTHARAMTTSVE